MTHSATSGAPPHRRGFTLIELAIAIAVLAIIASIALPSFIDAVRKSRRSEAFAALAAVQQAQERWRANNPAYTTDLSNAGLGLPTTTPGGYYTVAVNAADATGYTATASGVSGTSQAGDGNCTRLRVRAAGGNLFYESASGGGAFSTATGATCWSR